MATITLASTSSWSTGSTMATPSVASSVITPVPPGASGLSELDILFPQPNNTYPRVSPFPVIFAIQSPEVIYSYDFILDWDIYLDNCTEANSSACDVGPVSYGGRVSNRPNETGFPIPASVGAEPLFAFDTGGSNRSLGYGVWELVWRYYLGYDCRAGPHEVDQFMMPYIGQGTFHFTLAPTASPTNPLSSVCPSPGALVSILGTVTMDGFYPEFENCPTTASPPPPATAAPCRATLDAAGASSVLSVLGATVVTPAATPTTTRNAAASLKCSLLGLYAQAIIFICVFRLLYG